ncbi:MAG: imidazole glycerol phosphate synthase subunit HisH [bacterium]
MPVEISVVDYGLGNIRSVSKALEESGARVVVTNKPGEISNSRGVVFPGVGAFGKGMENVNKLGLLPYLVKEIKSGKPFLGICLGLQLLFTESEEHGNTAGFDIVKGKVKKFTGDIKIPHMGWNQIKLKMQDVKCKMFAGIPDNSYFYFDHSYYVKPDEDNIISAATSYGTVFTSAVIKDKIWGVQFHPEKSGKNGMRVLRNFLKNVSEKNNSLP